MLSINMGEDNEDFTYVECSIGSETFLIEVHPEWGRKGAKRFLKLVEEGYLDETALFRAVKDFLVQFGIGKDDEMRNEWRSKTITDDPPVDIKFTEGMMAFAGSGKNSRATEMFITLGKEVPSLGTQPWETPFGIIINGMDVVQNIYMGYGDIPPYGTGPNPSKIYGQGYGYLGIKFPKLTYIDTCEIVELVPEEEESLTIDADDIENIENLNQEDIDYLLSQDDLDEIPELHQLLQERKDSFLDSFELSESYDFLKDDNFMANLISCLAGIGIFITLLLCCYLRTRPKRRND